MGNTTAIIIICSICVFLILVLLIVYRKSSKKSASKKLDQEINRYKNLNHGEAVDYSNENTAKKNKNNKNNKNIKKEQKEIKRNKKIENKTLKLSKKISSKIVIDSLKNEESFKEDKLATEKIENLAENSFLEKTLFSKSLNDKNIENNDKFTKRIKKDKEREKDFDDFMNEFSFSRQIKDNFIENKIDNLPPKVKAVILENIFNKYDE